MLRELIAVSVVALCVGAGTTTAYAQANAQKPNNDTYTWNAELVSFDQTAKTLTVKASLVSDMAKEVAKFNVGDHVILTWSGIDQYANEIRGIAKANANQKVTDAFMLPAELASKDVAGNYVTVKVKATDAMIANDVKSLKPGQWLRFTSRHRPASDAQAVAAVEPYVKAGNSTN